MKLFLKKHGFKVTKSRLHILQALADANNKHLSAEDLFKLPENHASLATIYRILSQFEKASIIIKHNFEDDKRSVFELIVKGKHDHLVCVKCNQVIEFTDININKRISIIASKYGFSILGHTLKINGRCKNC